MRKLGLAVGVVFGFLLSWAWATRYDALRDMLMLRDFYLYEMMAVAVAVAAVGSHALRALGARTWIGGAPVTWTNSRPTRDTVVGSVIFGAGWAISSSCLGPTAAQIGGGQLTALFTFAGILGGVALREAVVRRSEAAPQTVGM